MEKIIIRKPHHNEYDDWIKIYKEYLDFYQTSLTTEDVNPSSVAGGSIAFEVEDLDLLVNRLKSKDVKFKLEVIESPVCRMAVAIDSEGNAFTLHQVKTPT